MNFDHIKNNKRYVSKALLIASLLLAILTVGKVLGFAVTSLRIGLRIEDAVAKNEHNDEAVQVSLTQSREAADKLKENNIFAGTKPKPKPPVCNGILGNMALINGKWYKVGDEVSGAKIVAIGPKDITIFWEDKEKKLVPFAESAKKDSGRTVSKPAKESRERRAEEVRPMREEGEGPGPGFGRRGMGRFFENMSEDERRELRERVRDMSREERREFFRQRREEFDSDEN